MTDSKKIIGNRGDVWQLDPETQRYMKVNPPAWSLPIEERMQSGRKNKDGTSRVYGWEDMYRSQPDRRRVCQGDNINFICQYLYENPGARYTEIMRALCEHNRIPYSRGKYSEYLSWRQIKYNQWPWYKCDIGWLLTPDGMVRAVDSRDAPDYNRNKYPIPYISPFK